MAPVWDFDAGSSSVEVGMCAGLEQDAGNASLSAPGPRIDWEQGKEVYYTRSQISYWIYIEIVGF